MPRTNSSGVTEVASIRGDMDKYAEGWDRIFNKKTSEEIQEDLERSEDDQKQNGKNE